MITLHLESDSATCTLTYLGDGVVYETMWDRINKVEVYATPHYLTDHTEAQEFMIRSSYALLTMGWRVAKRGD